MTKQRREGEANGPQGQRPARVSRGGPSWTEFVRLADQAVVAIAGAGMINRAEPRACGYSRDPRRLDTEPETERNAGPASNEAGDGFGRVQDDQAGFQPYWGKPAVRNEPRGWRNRRHDLMAICHDARKGRHSGSHWSKPARLRSTRPVIRLAIPPQRLTVANGSAATGNCNDYAYNILKMPSVPFRLRGCALAGGAVHNRG